MQAIVEAYPRLTPYEGERIVHAVFESMAHWLACGGRIEIRGFGSFVVKQRAAREGRNPKTGAPIRVPAKRVPFFKAGKALKDRVNEASAK